MSFDSPCVPEIGDFSAISHGMYERPSPRGAGAPFGGVRSSPAGGYFPGIPASSGIHPNAPLSHSFVVHRSTYRMDTSRVVRV